MQITASDVAFMKGESAMQPGDTAADALNRAAEHGYIVPGTQRAAFVAGFVANLPQDQAQATTTP